MQQDPNGGVCARITTSRADRVRERGSSRAQSSRHTIVIEHASVVGPAVNAAGAVIPRWTACLDSVQFFLGGRGRGVPTFA